jgi:hypothetical protein
MTRKIASKLIGKYGRWTIIKYVGKSISGEQMYEAVCECGSTHVVHGRTLTRNMSTQCNNCRLKEVKKSLTTHGQSYSLTYRVWDSMVRRCNNITHHAYKSYGGRGIKVCEEWLKFENFWKDMGEKPKGLQIDRINNDGNYEPNNCRWVTPKENMNNRRCSKNKE